MSTQRRSGRGEEFCWGHTSPSPSFARCESGKGQWNELFAKRTWEMGSFLKNIERFGGIDRKGDDSVRFK
jgi:hypothetical protein